MDWDEFISELVFRPKCLFCKHDWRHYGWSLKECLKCNTIRLDKTREKELGEILKRLGVL